MERERFDNLTRTLGAATSRRQLLKGLLGGLAAAVAVGRPPAPAAARPDSSSCNVQQCAQQAYEAAQECHAFCGIACRPGFNGPSNTCIACNAQCYAVYRHTVAACERNGCFPDETCCDQHCVNTRFDAHNCGACGHTCAALEECRYGRCVCSEPGTKCDDVCVDLQTDRNHCGSCTHACSSCEACFQGHCIPLACPEGQTCCKETCVPLCLGGDLPDPNTCQCNVCKGQMDGAACGPNLECCQEQCVSNQCPSPKQFDLDTCACQCPPVTCPSGQLQDPDTCQCVDLCANKTCGTCQTCDPTSGDCVPAADNTGCGVGQSCCGGVCCASGQSCCQGVCRDSSQGCCDSSVQVCYGANGQPTGECCPAGQGCTQEVNGSYIPVCCPLMGPDGPYPGDPYPALPGGTCCSGGNYYAVQCSAGNWVCCSGRTSGANPCNQVCL